jgi:hypothetical protein
MTHELERRDLLKASLGITAATAATAQPRKPSASDLSASAGAARDSSASC